MRVLVTGANGFVGVAVSDYLATRGHVARRGVRELSGSDSTNAVRLGNIGPDTDWSAALTGVDVVIHLAGRVHVMHESASDPFVEYRRVNVGGTESLVRDAVDAGVRRIVFVSSVKVHGEFTLHRPFIESDILRPEDAYGRSKLEAERVLFANSERHGIEAVVIRSPLVYGPRVRGNFLRIMKWVSRGWPLPLDDIDNRRSMIYVDNIAQMCVRCVDHPAAAGNVFLVSDGEDLSTTEIVRRLSTAFGRRPRLYALPPLLVRGIGRTMGQRAIQRLFGSLQVDISKARTLVGWEPSVTIGAGLSRTAAWYRDNVQSRSRQSSGERVDR